ncbi:MAG: nucleotidyltransferase [Crocinitomicaceae bacterium]|nr:nucleotidyltransferase [Crocinitomicaceae bacterium]
MKPALKEKFGVVRIGFFESYIDSHHHEDCELNILVELTRPLGWDFFALKEFIEFRLKTKIDICTPRALKPALKDEILAQTIFA